MTTTPNIELHTFDKELRQGYAVEVLRKDKSTFLAAAGVGDCPAAWTKANRRFAVAHADDLRRNRFSCRVVDVVFKPPVVIKGKGLR